MSKIQVGDDSNTKKQLLNPDPINGNQTWLRHKSNGESGLIDLMILQGNHSIEEMIQELSKNISLTTKSSAQWEKRIKDHILHLSTVKGDSRNKASGQDGHNIKVKENTAGKIVFDL